MYQTISSLCVFNTSDLRNRVLNEWRRRRDLNPRAGFPTYTLSRGASSANLSTSPCRRYEVKSCGGEGEIRTHGADASLDFKASSLNHSDTSPSTTNIIIPTIWGKVKNYFLQTAENVDRSISGSIPSRRFRWGGSFRKKI